MDSLNGIKNEFLLARGIKELARNEEIAFTSEKLSEFKEVRSGIGATCVAVFAYHKDVGLAGIHLDTTDPRVIETWLNKNIGNIGLIRMLGDTGFDSHPQLLNPEGVLTKVRRAVDRTFHQFASLTENPNKLTYFPFDTEIWLTGLGSYKPDTIKTIRQSINRILLPALEKPDYMNTRTEIRNLDLPKKDKLMQINPYLARSGEIGKPIYLPFTIEEKGLGTYQQIVYKDKSLSYKTKDFNLHKDID